MNNTLAPTIQDLLGHQPAAHSLDFFVVALIAFVAIVLAVTLRSVASSIRID